MKLEDFYSLIAENGQIREYLFESNVRDWEGNKQVNKQIKATLEQPSEGIDFWWLNNGITIIAENIEPQPPVLTLLNAQIVNGLQTSQCIMDCMSQPTFQSTTEIRHIIVRIVRSKNAEVQDKIIRATNSQTKIPPQYLWAHESRQRDIAEMFNNAGLFYERKKNSWRKAEKPLDDIVGPTELAQNFAAVMLQEPDHARARPDRYTKSPFRQHIFSSGIPIRQYVFCSLLRKRTEAYLETKQELEAHTNNLLFYVMMAIRPFLTERNTDGKVIRFQDVNVNAIPESIFESALEIVHAIYVKHGANDTAAKGPEMVKELKVELKNKFPAQPDVPVKRKARHRTA